jgi:hypothetical protein
MFNGNSSDKHKRKISKLSKKDIEDDFSFITLYIYTYTITFQQTTWKHGVNVFLKILKASGMK